MPGTKDVLRSAEEHLDSECAFKVLELSKQYKTRKSLDKISLSLKRGERLALMGANGAGKSSLLKILACLERPSSGKLTIFGINALKEADKLYSKIAYVSHDSQVYLQLSAQENLELFAKLRGVEHIQERIDMLLEITSLSHRRHDLVADFSQGMKQRLSIARAFLEAPNLLLLDEPFSALDLLGVQALKTLLVDLPEDTSIVLISHDPIEAYRFADTIVLMDEGSILSTVKTNAISEDAFTDLFKRSLLLGAQSLS
ncbi:MAG: ABC transporter ATP-binding protein [Coriobacteriia bacterium]|nr:ABC transporter ATP-binding protein [Coriobacteriia bacterium]